MRNAKTIAQLILSAPSSIAILERLGIDYSRNGQEDVRQACRNAGVTSRELIWLIESESKAPEPEYAGASDGSSPRR